jgi:CheY-like chemotaxis protein
LDSISSSTAAPSILIVEDDAPSREAVTHAPTQAGYEVVPASPGEDALDLIAAAEFDGLLGAIELPGRADGWEVGASFSFSFIWPDRPVIYVSAIAAPQPRLENLTAVRIKPASSFVYLS